MRRGCLEYFFSKNRQIPTNDAPVRTLLPSGSDSQILVETSADAADYISELPTSIIHHIMSYLSTKAVARTSLLSKRWNELRKSFPILNFNQNDFTGYCVDPETFSFLRKDGSFGSEIEKFINFVDVSLYQFCKLDFRIQKLRLLIALLDVKTSSSFVDKWIGLAIEKEVKELDLQVVVDGTTIYTLPQMIFYAKSITTLKLNGCKCTLKPPTDSLRFHSLKNLTLVRVSISEKMLQRLTSCCPLLEVLDLSHCYGLKHLCVSKALKLKFLDIDHSVSDELESVEIVGPSLQELKLEFSFEQAPLVIDLAGCSHLRKLKVVSAALIDQAFHQLIKKLPSLEELFLLFCCFDERMTISSNHLKMLQVSWCKDLNALDLDTPNLLSFIFTSESIPTSSINAPCPWNVEFSGFEFVFDTQVLLNLREFLGVSNKIGDLKIHIISIMDSMNLDEFRERCPLQPCNVENLYVFIQVLPTDYMLLLDGFLSVCYPRTFSVETCPFEAQNEFFKWLYKNLKNNRAEKCCKSRPIKCWRHYLKDVKIESFTGREDKEELNINELMDDWPILPEGILKLRIDWFFS